MPSRSLLAQGAHRHSTPRILDHARREAHLAAATVNGITEEQQAYEVRADGMQGCCHAWRVESKWYGIDGAFLTTSDKIISIRIPARLK